MTEGERPEILIARKGDSIEELKKIAQENFVERTKQPIKSEPSDEIKETVKGFGEIVGGYMERQNITMEQMLGLYKKQGDELVEALRGVGMEQERENWVDLEYRQEFWQRFEPRSWPKFYEKSHGEERLLWDARWQLARAAFIKKVTSGFPDKYRENQELSTLGKEQMEILYNMPGVKEMMHGYIEAAVNGTKFKIDEGKEISIWEIIDMDQFDQFREALRKQHLSPIKIGGLAAKEADAVAWNLLWVGNLLESLDSRYSYTGTSHRDIPGSIMAGEYKYVLHPQERFEGKCMARHFWGAFGKWGVTQLDRTRQECGFSSERGDEIRFSPAEKSDFWNWKRRSDLDKTTKKLGGRVFEVFTPECYPTTATGSFWEETKIELQQNGRYSKKSLLEFLLRGEVIPWNKVAQDSWIIYLTGKFHKAYALQEYFMGEKPLEYWKFTVPEWANPLSELFVRLGMEDGKFNRLIREGKSRQTFGDLKKWAVIAATGGVDKPHYKKVTTKIGFSDRYALEMALHSKFINYLRGKETIL